jgi:hypothetical protein
MTSPLALPSTSTTGAAALRVPEILQAVLEQLAERQRDLWPASVVNRIWSHFATQLLWRRVDSPKLERAPAARRAALAARVESLAFYLKTDDHWADDGGTVVDGDYFNHLAFPRLRCLRVEWNVGRGYSASLDDAIVDFILAQRDKLPLLTHVLIGGGGEYSGQYSSSTVSAGLFALLAHGGAALRSLEFDGPALSRRTLKPVAAAAAAAVAAAAAGEEVSVSAAAPDYLATAMTARGPFFDMLTRLATHIHSDAVAALVCFLPASLTTLHLWFSAEGTPSMAGGAMRQPLPAQPLVQLVAGLATHPARAARLCDLAVLYYEPSSSVSRAELDALRRLPQLEKLEVGPWGGPNDFPYLGGGPTIGEAVEADALDAPGFADADLARLLAALPRLASLTLLLRSALSPAALQLVADECPQLVRLNLWGRYPLYSLCVAATEHANQLNDASGRPIFPKLEWLSLTSIQQLNQPAQANTGNEGEQAEADLRCVHAYGSCVYERLKV